MSLPEKPTELPQKAVSSPVPQQGGTGDIWLGNAAKQAVTAFAAGAGVRERQNGRLAGPCRRFFGTFFGHSLAFFVSLCYTYAKWSIS